jgi:glycogen phosphorylase
VRVEAFQVVPALPEELQGLGEMALNVLWSWDEELRALFARLDRDLWERTYQNPVLMLGVIAQERLDALKRDDGFRALYARTYRHYQDYLAETTWWDRRYAERPLVAYFSAEFGLAECLPIYSGGLGVLAAHHLKSASDLGVPLVGVGLLYQQGYFRQYLTPDGWQHESYPTNDFYNLPARPVPAADGAPLRVGLQMAGRPLLIQVWRVEVGRLPLFLLDTNLPENPPDLRGITNQLYGGDGETRIRQEIVLGIGGLRALHAQGLRPQVCHMNEGHSAFLSLERIRSLIQEQGLPFPAAREAARAGNVFTTHTPVPAGFDVFSAELIDRYFSEYLAELGLARKDLLCLGEGDPAAPAGSFNMAGLALRTSAFVNGVSRLHAEVSRTLLGRYVPQIPIEEIPIEHVTNGAHTRSCVSREMAGLFDRYLGPDWWRRPGQAETWAGVDAIPDEELWATHERRRERLVAFARKRLMRQVQGRGGTQRDVERARGVLDTRALTIGFARRFATYKRANLILSDVERLKRILLDSHRPVQLIFAGKAHPRDTEAKEVLKSVVRFCQADEVRRHAVFVEDYDLVVARYLVQGVDVWLNTPRRGLEASGTSGMKVLPNGGLNLSVLDGWWPEAFEPELGWAIGKGEEFEDHAYQDYVESSALYDLLEKDVVPLFYQRTADGLPRAWIARMKKSMRKLSPLFSSNRMIWEYAERYYLPASRYFRAMTADGAERSRRFADWKRRVAEHWAEVRVESLAGSRPAALRVGEGLTLTAAIRLGALTPDDVSVEIYHGPLDSERRIRDARTVPMALEGAAGEFHRYTGVIRGERSGMQGYSVRVRPSHPDANNVLCTGRLTWLDAAT